MLSETLITFNHLTATIYIFKIHTDTLKFHRGAESAAVFHAMQGESCSTYR